MIGSIISAGASLIGGALANSSRRSTARESAQFGAAQSQAQMDFQREMSDTAVQRRMKDLRKSGINPILAARYDASTPAGAMATMPLAQQQDIVTPAIQSGLSAYQTEANVNQIEQQIEKIAAETDLTREQVTKVAHEVDAIIQTIEESKTRQSGIESQNTVNEWLGQLHDSVIANNKVNNERLYAMAQIVKMEREAYEKEPSLMRGKLQAQSGHFGATAASAERLLQRALDLLTGGPDRTLGTTVFDSKEQFIQWMKSRLGLSERGAQLGSKLKDLL